MPFAIKKRYARSTRFRTIMSNNLSLKQTRRLPLGFPTIPVVAFSPNTASLTFDRQIIVPSNAAEITGIKDNLGATADGFEQVNPFSVNIHFPSGTPTQIDVPFEDPAIRDQIGAYMNPGSYFEPD